MISKALVVVVTYNNPVLLQHVFESYKKYDPGYPCDFLIVDHGDHGDDQSFIDSLPFCPSQVITAPNDRVESSFNLAWETYPSYKYYFFVHDDACANRDNWLKVFVDRMESGHKEPLIEDTEFAELPIGRVGASTQFWRNYDSVLTPANYSVQCKFLLEGLKTRYPPEKIPKMFKYSDNDRVLVSNACLKATNGVWSLSRFRTMKEKDPDKFSQVCAALNGALQYPDEGVAPKSLYPPGETWCKLLLFSEFMTSVESLIEGFRVVGLEGDGYLEQIHGYDQLWGHNYIHHYGAPNFKQSIARAMNADVSEVTPNFNNKIFLMKCDQIVQKYFK